MGIIFLVVFGYTNLEQFLLFYLMDCNFVLQYSIHSMDISKISSLANLLNTETNRHTSHCISQVAYCDSIETAWHYWNGSCLGENNLTAFHPFPPSSISQHNAGRAKGGETKPETEGEKWLPFAIRTTTLTSSSLNCWL